jgi:hypothetical protein
MVCRGRRVNQRIGWSEDGVSNKNIKAIQKSRKPNKYLQTSNAVNYYNL